MLNRCPAPSHLLHVLLLGLPCLVAAAAPASGDPPDGRAFTPQIGICSSIENAKLLQQSGGDYIEVSVRRFLVPDKPDADFAENLKAARACGVPIRAANGFLPGSLKCVGPDADHQAVLAYAKTAFERAKRVGIKTIVFGSSEARSIPEGFDRSRAEQQFIALVMKMGPLAAANDVVVAIEPLNTGETNFINTLRDGARIVETAGHPNIRLVADLFHMARMNEKPKELCFYSRLIEHVHVAEKAGRTPPGVEGDDFRGHFEALQDSGYRGGISIECRWKDMATQLPVAIQTLREHAADTQPDFSYCMMISVRRPSSAIPVLFSTSRPQWTHADGGPVRWKLVDGAVQVVPGTGSIVTTRVFQDFRLHVEFNVPQLPPLPEGADRGNRGNSGVYLQRRYEIQILDSYGVKPKSWDCGALYRVRAPDRNASKPPGEWQSYDVLFRAPRWKGKGDDAHKIENARITVLHNGVLIHNDVELKNKTGAGQIEGPEPGPILLQDHGNEVQFRDVWVVPLD